MFTERISYSNEVQCEHFSRSVTQQLLYGLAYNSWLYQGGLVHLNAIFVCAQKCLCELMDTGIFKAHYFLFSC